MTEAEWQACTDPQPMLDFLRGRVSERKLRLFAAACCRRAWHLLFHEWSRRAVEAAERSADGTLEEEELARAASAAGSAALYQLAGPLPTSAGALRSAAFAALNAAHDDPHTAADNAAANVASAAYHAATAAGLLVAAAAHQAERAALARLVMEVFGNPFRPTPVAASVLRWNGGRVPKLALAIYEGRRFDDLPVLADALEEAGCDNEKVLGHLRGPGPHVRGCHVLDLILGRE
jgi:hypothetical protein